MSIDSRTRLRVGSGGGPPVAVPQDAVRFWRSPREDPDADEPAGRSDRGRACEVDDHLGIVEIADARAPVLGDVPAVTTYVPEHRLLVRWEGAESETALPSSLDRALVLTVQRALVPRTA